MKMLQLAELVYSQFENGDRTPITLLGSPGIGKTSAGREVADLMTQRMEGQRGEPAICLVLDLSSMLPEDLLGLPYRENGVTKYAPQEWLAELCEPGSYGILILDDLPAAAPSVQVAARQLVLERRVHNHYLSEDVIIMVTGNRREDKASASTLPAHFRNSVCLMQVEPELEEWCQWYGKQPKLCRNIPSFLRYRPTHLSKLPKDADKMGAFATPRTWAKLGGMWEVAHKMGFGLEVAMGCVGEGPAMEFIAYVNVKSQLVNPEEVLRNPKKAIPNPSAELHSPDRAYAMITGLAEVAAQWNKDRKAGTGLAFLQAVGHCCVGNEEYCSVAINTYTAEGGKLDALLKAARSNPNDPDVSFVIGFLRKGL
jgi:hypothetical protein